MNAIMSASWKSIDNFTRSVFEELAEEGRHIYHKRGADYNEKYPSSPKKKKKKKKVKLGISIATPEEVRSKKLHVVDTVKSSSLVVTPRKTQPKKLHKTTRSKDAVPQRSPSNDYVLQSSSATGVVLSNPKAPKKRQIQGQGHLAPQTSSIRLQFFLSVQKIQDYRSTQKWRRFQGEYQSIDNGCFGPRRISSHCMYNVS